MNFEDEVIGKNGMIGAVVVLYNPKEEEVENIRSYQDEVDCLVIIDNSNLNNEALIKKHVVLSENKVYISHLDNVGLCKALNEGIEILQGKGCKWAVVFDADSKLGTNIFECYRDIATKYDEKDKVAAFAPQHSFDRSPKKEYEGYKVVGWAMTSGCMINIDAFYKIGGFFEPLFVDGIDMDFCYHAQEKGYQIVECGRAVINHHPAETRKIVFLRKEFLYGYASADRYHMQARSLIWNILRYRKYDNILIYGYKWFKVLFLFAEKKSYIRFMCRGTREGISLYRKYKQGSYRN